MTKVKICGLTTPEMVDAAVQAGALYVGFVFFPKSPRAVDVNLARSLALEVPAGIMKVGLAVDPTDAELNEILQNTPLDMIQLHGKETPMRVTEVKKRFGLPVMKALSVATRDDLLMLKDYEVADQLLIDAKAPKNAELPGGNGQSFDWSILKGIEIERPWMLAGGLTPENVAQAILITGARQVDVSSGVEREKGIKDKGLIEAFVKSARGKHE